MSVAKWAYVLIFDLDESMIEEKTIEQFDKDVSKKLNEIGKPYELIPVPYSLVKLILSSKKECDERGD